MLLGMLTLEPVTPENYDATLALTVAPDQASFVAPVVKSLADAWVWREGAIPLAAIEDGAVVGFVLLYYPFEAEGSDHITLVRFMVDAQHQRRGLGAALITETMDHARALVPRPSRMKLSVMPENGGAQRLYERFGFAGIEIEDDERVMWRDL